MAEPASKKFLSPNICAVQVKSGENTELIASAIPIGK